MAQMKWTYVADSGTPYRVTLYHGPQSGHVLVAINGKISIVDFFVRESRNYSLLLEDELMLVEIEKGPDGYSYGFSIDEEADTQRNRDRRREAWHRNRLIALVAVVALGAFLWLVMLLHSRQEARLTREALPHLHERGLRGMARLGRDPDGEAQWYYPAGKQIFTLPAGPWPDSLPALAAGDDLLVYYLPRKPAVARLDPEQSGPRRSRRLFREWWSIQVEGTHGRDWLDECLLPYLQADTLLLAHPASPWQRRPATDLEPWLQSQPELQLRIRRHCPE